MAVTFDIRMRFLRRFSIALVVCLFAATALARESERTRFNRDVLPILSDNCFQCHGPDPNTRKAGLRLDDRDEAIRMAAIVPGNAEESELIHRITTDDTDDLMPPPKSNKELTAREKEVLAQWILEGAEYEPH